jgi:heme exporter protein C
MTYNRYLRWLYKALAVGLLTYAVLGGLLFELPRMQQLGQSSRSLFFHLPMWFTMYLLMLISLVWSIGYLRTGRLKFDRRAREAAVVAIFFGVLGLTTGIVWARVAWVPASQSNLDPSTWWVWDPKQTTALIALLIYVAYLVLRNSVDEDQTRARFAAVYNIFAGVSVFPLTYVVPRLVEGLHPGSPGSGTEFATEYRIVLYPAILGFMLLALWMLELRVRLQDFRAQQLTAPSQ